MFNLSERTNICHWSTYNPIDSFKLSKRFWSNFKIVKRRNLAIPFGNVSNTFCDKCKSVKFTRPPISSGNSSNLNGEQKKKWKTEKYEISLICISNEIML